MPPLPGMNPGEWAASPWVQAPAALILWIATSNFFNRLNVPTKPVAGAAW